MGYPNPTFGVPQYNIQAPSDRPSWVVPFGATAPTAATDLFAVEAGAKPIRLMRIVIWQIGQQTTPGNVGVQIVRTKAAGVGSTVTPVRVGNKADGATFGGICRAGNAGANVGTLDDVIASESPWVPGATAAMTPIVFEMGGQGMCYEVPTCAASTATQTNGLAFRHPGATGATAWTGYAVFCEDPA
jgi:hypothetical protein